MTRRKVSYEAAIPLRVDPEYSEEPAEMWFEIVPTIAGGGYVYLGVDSGSRPVVPTLRVSLSDAMGNPMADLVALAENAFKGEIPFSIEIDSEGPLSKWTIRPGGSETVAIFEIHETLSPVILFAAAVDRTQFAIALAHAFQVAIREPAFHEAWVSWTHYRRTTFHDYFDSTWFRDLVIVKPPQSDLFEPYVTHNRERYHKDLDW
jgi:hypothetical protein